MCVCVCAIPSFLTRTHMPVHRTDGSYVGSLGKCEGSIYEDVDFAPDGNVLAADAGFRRISVIDRGECL